MSNIHRNRKSRKGQASSSIASRPSRNSNSQGEDHFDVRPASTAFKEKSTALGRPQDDRSPVDDTFHSDGGVAVPTRDLYLSPPQLAKVLGIAIRTLARWRALGTGPPFAVLGQKKIVYRASSVERWLATSERPTRSNS